MKIGKKSGLKYFSISDIRAWGPCYDPAKFIPEDWRGTAVDILNLKEVSQPDRLWVALRTDLVSERTMRLFAAWCARQVQHLMTDLRSIHALDVAERFANGEASEAERAAAWAAARDAAWDATGDAAWAAAWAATWAAARDAPWDATWDAAWGAAWAAAGDAAWGAAWAAARDAQVSKLIEMVEAEGKERVSKRGLRFALAAKEREKTL